MNGQRGYGASVQQPVSPIPYRKLYRWGLRVIGWAPGLFGVALVLNLAYIFVAQFSGALLPGLVKLIGGTPGAQPQWFLPSEPKVALLLFVGLMGGKLLLSFATRIATTYTDRKLEVRLQARLHGTLLRLGPEYHHDRPLGERSQTIKSYASAAERLLTDIYATPLTAGVGVVVGVYLLFENLSQFTVLPGWVLAGMLSVLVASPIVAWKIAGKLRLAFRAVRDQDLILSNEIINSLEDPTEVQLLGAVERRQQRFVATLRRHFRVLLPAAMYTEVANQTPAIMTLLIQVLFLIAAVTYGAGGDVASAVVAVVFQVPLVVAPLQEIVGFATSIQSMWPMTEKVVQLLDAEPLIQDPPNAPALTLEGPPTIELQGVSFAYTPEGRKLLDGVDHVFPAGKVSAIVALSGMGKSTVLSLLGRVYDPQAGEVAIGGQDLRAVSLDSLRSSRNCAKAAQQPLFIQDSVRENFLLCGELSDARIREVCEQTGFWAVLERLSPDAPLEIQVPRNLNQGAFSGGELRRFGVTRTLLHDPQVLLLDEPTTGVSGTEKKQVLECLELACEGKTVILVEHDMNFVRALADEVVVLEDGKFTEVGPPEELLAREDSRFRRFHDDYVKSHHGEG